jgi:hypothetical protein
MLWRRLQAAMDMVPLENFLKSSPFNALETTEALGRMKLIGKHRA